MAVSDPIADMLTTIRNAVMVGHESVVVPRSRLKLEIARILKEEGFVEAISEESGPRGPSFRLTLRYDHGRTPVLKGIRRISTPGRRQYVGKDEIPHVRNGLGVAILTTPQGVLTDRAARVAGVGGEVLCYVW